MGIDESVWKLTNPGSQLNYDQQQIQYSPEHGFALTKVVV